MNRDKFLLAPLHGYTCPVFRKTFMAFEPEIDIIVPPFIVTAPQFNHSEEFLKKFLATPSEGISIVPQIMGNHPESFIRLSEKLHALGYQEVNWNIGCPFQKITRKFRGAMILSDPDFIDDFLSKVTDRLPCKLSIKTRTGISNHSELPILLKIFNKHPIESVILHPRTAFQKYEGSADTEVFRKAIDLSEKKLIYNGDIHSVEDFKHRKESFNTTDSWMIGRGLIANPFLVKSIKRGFIPSNSDFDKFHRSLYAHFSNNSPTPEKLLNVMKGYWSFFKDSFGQQSKVVFKKINRTSCIDEYDERVAEVVEGFSFNPED